MTFDELERCLPNGLHDAELLTIEIDYNSCRATVGVKIDLSSPDGVSDDDESVYREAKLTFTGVQFLAIDLPQAIDVIPGAPVIDAGGGQPNTALANIPNLSEGSFLCWIFVSQTNSFIRIAARTVELQWLRSD